MFYKKYKQIIYITQLLAILNCTKLLQAQTPAGTQFPGAGTQTINPVPSSYATGTPVNFVRSWDAIKPLSTELAVFTSTNNQEVKKTTQYVDGLGRPLQTVAWQITPSGKDMVSPVVYDAYGKETFKYLPYAATGNNGALKTNPFNDQQSFMQATYNQTNNSGGEKYFYSKTDYEASPLDRVTKIYAQGNNWVGDAVGVSVQYLVNTINDNVRIWNIGFTIGNVPADGGVYPSGQLLKTITIDESGHNVIEFKDKEGHVILKKVESSTPHPDQYTGWLCTYYVYDDLGNLRFVMQPDAVAYLAAHSWTLDGSNWSTSAVAKGQCFSYEYDERQRMIIKRVPDAGEVYLVYDVLDRLVMTQDENLRGGAQPKWLVTIYDMQNRPIQTGLLNDNNTRAYHQNLAGKSSTYPNTATGFELLSETHYDSYKWITDNSVPLSTTLISANTANTQYFYTASNTTYPYPQAIAANYQNRNMVTGTKTEVLGTSPPVYLYSVNFYDDRARLIQTQSTNYSNGSSTVRDTVTTQYSFSGQALRVLAAHNKAGGTIQYYRVCTKNEYDVAGRLTKVSKLIGNQFNAGKEVVLSANYYDELGQLKEKDLGQQVDATNTTTYNYLSTPVDILNYEYNVRGWLRGINKNYAENTGNSNAWFGIELCYDFGFSSSQLNGNIAGERWRSKGDGEQRAYGFSYDFVNRLTGGDYNQLTGSSWDKSKTNFTVSNLSYDANGNISSMTEMGMVANKMQPLDALAYNYVANSNKLNYVNDTGTPQSNSGDFTQPSTGNGSGTTQDYSYDANGNLAIDNNKGISSITYNYLNLPSVVTITNKGTITYTYDASGNKLRKVTVDNTVNPHVTTTADYIGSFIYQNNVLQFISTEEGRARPATPGNFDTFYYDYFEKDHLGNVRVVLTDQIKQDIYPVADVESSNTAALTIEKQYYDIQDANIVDESIITAFYGTTTNEYQNNNGNPPYNNNFSANVGAKSTKLYKLNGASGTKTGLAITLRVMSGDVVNIFGKSYYHLNSGQSPANNYLITSTLLSFLNVFTGSSAVTAGHSGVTGSTLNSSSQITDPLSTWLNSSTHTPPGSTPKAYINWVFLDEQFNPVTTSMSGASRVSDANNTLLSHNIPTINITRNGYLYIYCSNESDVNVFFDNLQAIQTHGPLVEETHYYPFGLTMAGISSRALNFGGSENKIKFQKQEQQSKEFSDGSGLDMYEFKYRFDDPQIGRFWSIDPLASDYVYNSPYNFSEDKVTSHIELEGLETFSVQDLWRSAGITSSTDPKEFVGQVAQESTKPRAWINAYGAAAAAGVGVMVGVMTEGIGGAEISEETVSGAMKNAAAETREINLGQRANEIHSALPPKTQDFNTTAVASATTSDGKSVILVGSNEKVLRPVQLDALRPGEIAVSGEGKAHAEVRITTYAEKNNITVNAVAASRPICDGCVTAINNAGAVPASPLKVVTQKPATDATYVAPPPIKIAAPRQ